MNDIDLLLAGPDDWARLPLIYEADGYDRAADLMREGAAAELEQYHRGDRILYFALAGDVPVGTAGLVFRGRDAGFADGTTSANVNRLHVITAQRRRGVGTLLMTAIEDEARRCGYRRLTIEVEDDNEPALALYEKLGFVHTGPGHGANELAMAKELRSGPE